MKPVPDAKKIGDHCLGHRCELEARLVKAPHPDPTTSKCISSVLEGQASSLREGLSFKCVWEEQFMVPQPCLGPG